jgi:hypothetical protein
MADTNTINVGCTHPLGMRLGVYEWTGEGDARTLVPVGTLELAGNGGGPEVFTPVDAALFAKWMALNADTDLVKNGEVFTAGKAPAA